MSVEEEGASVLAEWGGEAVAGQQKKKCECINVELLVRLT